MKITEAQIKKIVNRVLSEQVEGPSHYAWKSDKLAEALSILHEVQDAEERAPGGESEMLQGIIDELEGVLDAVNAMV